jgi:hypothetical protein
VLIRLRAEKRRRGGGGGGPSEASTRASHRLVADPVGIASFMTSESAK